MVERLKALLPLAAAAALLLPATQVHAQQGKVLLSDSRTVTIDIGADREIKLGMEGDVFREYGPITHPHTGENMGRHVARIARIRVDKVEANMAVCVYVDRLATVRTGDIVKGFDLAPTYEEEIRTEVREARSEIKAIARSLAEEINTNKREIEKINSTLRNVDATRRKMDTLINSVMNMRQRMVAIEGRLDSLSRQTTVIDSISEVQTLGFSEFRELGVLTREGDEAIYIQVGERVFLLNLETEQLEDATPMAVPAGSMTEQPAAMSAPEEEELFPEDEEAEEETPFYIAYWWIAPIIGVLGAALLFVMKMMGRSSGAADDDESDDEAFPAADDEPFPTVDGDEDGGDELELPEEIPELEEVETAEGEET